MNNRLFAVILGLAALGLASDPGAARASSFDREAERFVGGLGAATSAAFSSNTGRSQAERDRTLYAFMDSFVDVPAIARFTIGHHWNQASPRQRAEFTALFRGFLAHSVLGRISQLAGASIDVQKVVPVKAVKSRDVLVVSRITITKRSSSLGVVWRVRKTKAGPKLVDVMVAGISMAVLQREEYASFLRANGGDVDTIIAALRDKTDRAVQLVAEKRD
jgi:phospholipid transport system substrate-binding protein